MIDYPLSIDLSGGKDPDGYFQINAISVEPFKEQPIDGMLSTRYSWGTVTVKNEPYKYAKLGGDRYKLFDILKSLPLNQEIHIKFISQYQTIEGYFGVVDCKLNDDKKTITITPTTLDQYTAFLENRDNEVELFKENNLIVNGSFKDGTNNTPDSWAFSGWNKTSDYVFLEKKYVNDKSCIAICDLGYTEEEIDPDLCIYQTANNILKGNQVNLSFWWALQGLLSDERTFNLSYSITLYDALNPLVRYGLNNNGTWSLLTEFNNAPRIYYKNNVTQVPSESLKLYPYQLITNNTPITGNIKIEFFRYNSNIFEPDTKILLTDINLSASAIELKTIRIEFNPDNLVTFDQSSDEIYWKGKSHLDKYFTRVPSDQRTIADYINADGNPKSPSYLNNSSYGITSNGNLTYANLAQFFQDKNSKSYKFEISELTIYKGIYRHGNKRNWYATAKFSREQVYTMDTYDSQTKTWIKNIPADGVGWEDINVDNQNDHRRLWVRTPFNGQDNGWTLGEVDSSATLRRHTLGFDYYDSLTTVKNYPIPANKTKEITNAIDIREIFTKLYQGTDESLKGKQVKSSFLWNDTQSETISNTIGLTSGINYYTKTANELNNIAVIHTFDLKTEVNTDDKNTYMVVSPKKFMDDFFNVYFPQCYWFIDDEGNLNIEHISFFDAINTPKSLLEPKYSYLGNYRSWEYVKDKLFALEQYETVNSGYPDFKSSKVTFDKIATNKRNEDLKGDYKSSIISTDVQYCSENANSLDSGLVLIAYTNDNGTNIASKGVGQKTGISLINGSLSISTLLDRYANYEGTWTEGLLNGKGNNPNGKQSFKFTKRAKQGAELEIKGIFLDRVILTDLGRGVISSRTIDYNNEKTNVTAVYRHSDNVIVMANDVIVKTDDQPIITPTLATVTTDVVANITSNSATCSGTVLSEGSEHVTESGIVYGIEDTPTLDNSDKIDISSGLSTFVATMPDLEPLNIYRVRAYAINSVGVAYGTIKRFKTKIE